MKNPRLNFLALYSPQPLELLKFYSGLGLEFTEEKHGTGLTHWACDAGGGLVLEIYPAQKERSVSPLTLGFDVTSLQEIMEKMGISARPDKSVVLLDPDGRKVFLRESS